MSIKPIRYNLQIEPDVKNFTFKGWETISFEATAGTDSIILDSVDLTIESCTLKNSDCTVSEFNTDEKALIIKFDTIIPEGVYELELQFRGKINNTLAGLYLSRYSTVNGEQLLVTTQFEPADARRVFPCVDNPSCKALFDVSMIVDESLTAISNTPVIKEEKRDNNKKIVIFETTPLMSTYLLYMGAGEFEKREEHYNNILIRGITTRGKAIHTRFAIECAKKSLEYFEEYFGVPYPLKKLDLIAVPDFEAGAMENLGAITFRESAILFYEQSSSVLTKQRIAEVVAHEVAHQWFGNLVTMKWWDDLWLNESFATFMAYKVIDKYWPEWSIWTEYVRTTVFNGMKLDALNSSHPVHVEVPDVSQTYELFDEIAYDKGGSVLRMIEKYLGEDAFRSALQSYIQKFTNQNTEANDLWRYMEAVSGSAVAAIMQSQINQTGFPCITVTDENSEISLRQERFLLNGKNDEAPLWIVPAVIRSDEETMPVLIDSKSTTMRIKKPDSLFYGNENYSGFFITEYSQNLLERLTDKRNALSDTEKIGLIHDFDLLVFAGKKQLPDFLHFIDLNFREENSEIVILYILEKLNKIFLLLSDEKSGRPLREFAKKGIKQTGFIPTKDDHPFKTNLRAVSLMSLSYSEDDEVRNFVIEQVKNISSEHNSIHPDLRSCVYPLAVWFEESNYEKFMKLYLNSSNQEENIRFLTAFGHAKNSDYILRSLEFALSDRVRFNQIHYLIVSLVSNPSGQSLTFDWLMKNWDMLMVKAGGSINHIVRILLKEIIPNCGIGNSEAVHSFIQKHNSPDFSKTFNQILEEFEINESFVQRNKL